MTLSKKQNGFTLIELITVIAIIMILMGLLFPAFNAAKEAARRAQAKNDMTQIVTAVNAYYTEYGTYPLLDAQVSGSTDAVFGAPGGTYKNDALINVLVCPNNVSYWTDSQNVNPQNPRRIQFLTANSVKSSTAQKGGIAIANGRAPDGATFKQGAFIDPWGDPYVVFIDANYDGNISTLIGNYYTDWQTSGLNISVGVCSLGKNGLWGNGPSAPTQCANSDDVVSWQ